MNRFDKQRAEINATDWTPAFKALRIRSVDRAEERFMVKQLRDAEQRIRAIKERRAAFQEERETRAARTALRRDLRRSLRCYFPLPEGAQQ